MVTAEGRGKQDSWVLFLSFLLTLGELFQLPETQFLHLQNRGEQAVTVRQNCSLCLEAPEKIQGLGLSCREWWRGTPQWRPYPGTHGAVAQKLVSPLPKGEGWKEIFAKKSSSFASANPLLLTDLFLLSAISAVLAHAVPYGRISQALYPFYGAERVSEAMGGSWQALTSLLLDSQTGVWGQGPATLPGCTGKAHGMRCSSFKREQNNFTATPWLLLLLLLWKCSFQRCSSVNTSFPALTSYFVAPGPWFFCFP